MNRKFTLKLPGDIKFALCESLVFTCCTLVTFYRSGLEHDSDSQQWRPHMEKELFDCDCHITVKGVANCNSYAIFFSIGVSTSWRRGKVVQSSLKLLQRDLGRIVEQMAKKEKKGFLPGTFLTLK